MIGTPEYPKAPSPLEHLAVFSDWGVDKNWECAVEDAAWSATLPERIVAKAYRNARRRAPNWKPGVKDHSNAAFVSPEWSDPHAVAERLAMAMMDEPDADPEALLRRVLSQRGRVAGPQNVCDHCGVEFTAKRSDAKFCKSRCRQAAAREKRSGVSQVAA